MENITVKKKPALLRLGFNGDKIAGKIGFRSKAMTKRTYKKINPISLYQNGLFIVMFPPYGALFCVEIVYLNLRNVISESPLLKLKGSTPVVICGKKFHIYKASYIYNPVSFSILKINYITK